jgi:hypothetical protein
MLVLFVISLLLLDKIIRIYHMTCKHMAGSGHTYAHRQKEDIRIKVSIDGYHFKMAGYWYR